VAKKKVLCVGTAAVDITGRSSQEMLLGSSVPGITDFCVGGIARNMSENFARLGCEAYLLSIVGTDILGEFILNETRKGGVRTEYIEKRAEYSTALRVAILNARGVIQYAVFGDSIFKYLSSAYLERFVFLLRSVDLLVTQTTLPTESLIYLASIAQEYAIPLYINATSVPLASRLLAVIDKAPILGANQKEAENLTGCTIESPSEAIQVGKSLLGVGAKEVIITLGPEGVVYCKQDIAYHYKALPAQSVDTTGAGDALCSALLSCLLDGQTIAYSLEYGLIAAALTIESMYAVSPLLSPESIQHRMAQSR
jgi:pseudouridine kinase